MEKAEKRRGKEWGKIVESYTSGNTIYQRKHVWCGKPNCTRCPHGPYWYAKINIGKGNPIIRYIGKNLPAVIITEKLNMPGGEK